VRGELDLAVVGGGVAGMYVAYRLATLHPDWSIAVFERTERIGGRLLSASPPGLTSRRAEFGGMRYRADHPRVGALVRELGLEVHPFNVVDGDNRFYLRERASRAEDGVRTDGYRVDRAEARRTPADLLGHAFERIVPDAFALDASAWEVVKREHRYQGRLLSDWTMRDALLSVLSAEAYALTVDWLGYSAIVGTRNAADAIPYVIGESRPEADIQVAVVGGMDRLPSTIGERVVSNGGEIHLGMALEAFTAAASTGSWAIRMGFADGSQAIARRMVLALPRQPLEALAMRTPYLQPAELAGLIASVQLQDSAKLYLLYDRPWWREIGVRGHRAITDLPIRKTYYFDRIDGVDPGEGALLLASYTDTDDVGPWRALAGSPPRAPGGGDIDTLSEWDQHPATQAQVGQAQRQLALVHGVDSVPTPVAAAFVDWGVSRLETGWHFWKAGARSSDVMHRILQPVPGTPIFICGEAYSPSQGWIEGALESADQVLDRLT
jgi:monoamine oxidase